MAGMILSVPLSVITSRVNPGSETRRLGLFVTPEETNPPAELAGLRARMTLLEEQGETAPRPTDYGIARVILDPYVNAVHVSLLRERLIDPAFSDSLAKLQAGFPQPRELSEKLLASGPAALKPQEKLIVLSDADLMSWLHRQAWLRPSETLASWWQTAIRQYAR
jgi:membrane glycosyltransferase